MGLNYTPQFEINNALLQNRVERLVLTDSAGYQSDTLNLTVNMAGIDRANWPRSGTELTVKLGWLESGLVEMGSFIISKITPKYLPKKAEITATAAPFNAKAGRLKLRRSETYTDVTLGDLVRYIANRINLSPRVHADFDALKIAHIDQKNESDLSFLQRLASKFDAAVKPINDLLVFGRRGQTKTLSGKPVPVVSLQLYSGNKAPQNALLSVDFTEPERDMYRGVYADFIDSDNAEIVRYKTGQDPFKQLTGRYNSPEDAVNAAKGELMRLKRGGIKVKFSVAGDPNIMAESAIDLSGFDEDHLNGKYSNDIVTHTFIPGETYKTSGTASALV